MATIVEVLDEAITSVDKLRAFLSKSKTTQVSAGDEKTVIKATSLAWINHSRPVLKIITGTDLLQIIDAQFQETLEASDRKALRSLYIGRLKKLKSSLVKLRSHALTLTTTGAIVETDNPNPPDFTKLIPHGPMQAILNRRWTEAWSCLKAGAYLSSTVMMGAILEALLLARINKMADKTAIFNSKCAPKDKATGKTRPLQEWTLNSYIDVAHDLGWIGKASRDIGVVLRDYRNFIHPEKEFSQGISVNEPDCRMFAAILVVLAEQIINS